MAEVYKLWKPCPTCRGTGKILSGAESPYNGAEIVCASCNGTKVIFDGYCSVATYQVPEVPA